MPVKEGLTQEGAITARALTGIREIARAYRETLTENRPASILKILAEASKCMSEEEIQVLHEELLAVWFASKVEEHAGYLSND